MVQSLSGLVSVPQKAPIIQQTLPIETKSDVSLPVEEKKVNDQIPKHSSWLRKILLPAVAITATGLITAPSCSCPCPSKTSRLISGVLSVALSVAITAAAKLGAFGKHCRRFFE